MAEEYRGLEENLYWTHFKYMHFFQVLTGDFKRELPIPMKFATNMKLKLPEIIELKGPSGAMWNVGLTSMGDKLFFKLGWKQFVSDHSLKQGDLLMFRYNGDSHFDVLMFDQENFCEIESSYFVKTRDREEVSVEDSLDFSEDNDDRVSSEKKCRIRIDDDYSPRPLRRKSRGKGKSRARKCDYGTSSLPLSQMLTNEEAVHYGSFEEGRVTIKLTRSVQIISNRRAITEEEKNKALQMAEVAASSKKNYFIVVMGPSQVYKSFQLYVPSPWVDKHLERKNQDVTLRIDNNKAWNARFYVRGSGGVLDGAWKYFAVENRLEESDVCVFELVDGTDNDNGVVLDVAIFRVVAEEEVSPPTIVSSRRLSSRLGTRTKNVMEGNLLIEGTGDDVALVNSRRPSTRLGTRTKNLAEGNLLMEETGDDFAPISAE